jgi:hypothetical protein
MWPFPWVSSTNTKPPADRRTSRSLVSNSTMPSSHTASTRPGGVCQPTSRPPAGTWEKRIGTPDSGPRARPALVREKRRHRHRPSSSRPATVGLPSAADAPLQQRIGEMPSSAVEWRVAHGWSALSYGRRGANWQRLPITDQACSTSSGRKLVVGFNHDPPNGRTLVALKPYFRFEGSALPCFSATNTTWHFRLQVSSDRMSTRCRKLLLVPD